MKNTKEQKKAISIKSAGALKTFPFLRTLTIISFLSLVVAGLFLGFSAKKILVDSLLENEERRNVAVTQILGNGVWDSFGKFITSLEGLSGDEIRNKAQIYFIEKYILNEIEGLNVVKIKIYNLDGLTVFSTDLSQVGKSKRAHKSFIKAKDGEVVSKLSFRDKIYAKEELIENRNIITSYIPLRQKQGDVVSVFEVYSDVTQLVDKINHLQRKIMIGIVFTITVLFAILFFTIRHASEVIEKYNVAQEKETDTIREIAFYDHLTGLPNRILFIDRLEHAIDIASRNNKLVVLMFIDLDRFKQVNDNLGHEAGDKLLCQISSRISKLVRPSDTVSRISGDEFTVVLEGLSDLDFSTVVAQRIQSKMEEPFLIEKNKVVVTCSIGISVYPFSDDDVESLIKKADAAMFFSKSVGRNTFHYYSPDMLEHGSQRYVIETELNTALIEKQFSLVFQPTVDLVNWTMQGMETFIRWNHPTKGLIKPEVYMPVLEETGLIIHVGEWMIRESCRLNKQWQDTGLPALRVAVNISSVQLNHPDFIDMVTSVLSTTKLEAKYLELELSERRLIDDEENNIKNMQALRDKGVHLTINNFGTGSSSLSYLSKLPIESLKIDKVFMRDMIGDTKKRSVTTAIISFAHSMKLNIIVEGVETKEQLVFVSAMRCSLVQGPLISECLNYDEFDKIYKSGGDFSSLIESNAS